MIGARQITRLNEKVFRDFGYLIMKQCSSWRTTDEARFLMSIGRWSARGGDPKDLLWKYVAASAYRHDWGEMDKSRCVVLARGMLHKLLEEESIAKEATYSSRAIKLRGMGATPAALPASQSSEDIDETEGELKNG